MITQEFRLNMVPESDPVVVHVNQCDQGTGRLIAHLYHNDNPYTPTNATAIIQGTKPDKKGFGYSGVTISGNTVTANLTEQMTAVPGEVRTQFVITDGYGVTGTFAFILEVQASALDADTDTSETEIPGIIDAARQSAHQAAASAAAALLSEQHAKSSEDAALLSEQHAKASEDAALLSEQHASASEQAAGTSESNAEAWAVGERNGEAVPNTDPTYHNNSKYYSGLAGGSATAAALSEQHASASEQAAGTSASNSEAWAVGERGGEPVPSTDPTYENNAKHWAEVAEAAAAHGGHTIEDLNGTGYTNRTNLQFLGSEVVDDEDGDTTRVNPTILPLYMSLQNDFFTPILTDDGKLILTDDDDVIFANWHYKYT